MSKATYFRVKALVYKFMIMLVVVFPYPRVCLPLRKPPRNCILALDQVIVVII